jgi:hypothetical protein
VSELDEEKLFYERFWALHNDPVLLSVFKQFGIGVFRRSSVLEGFASFIKAKRFSGQRCIEIGSCKGLTALVLARYFDEVVSIDIVEDGDREAIANYCGVRNIRFVTVVNNEEKAAVINGLTFDGAYVDGDHARDTVTDFALVKRCGQVLFHEYWPAQPPVWNLVNSLGNAVTHGKLALWKS